MRLLAKPMGYLLMWLYQFIGDYGICLVIFTVAVKLATYPLYAKQIVSTVKMSKVQPKIREIQQKYAKDQQTQNEKIQELYQKEGVSMTSGCMPMVVQMFVIMALFALLRNPMLYFGSMEAASADMMLFAIHEPFLWIKDLAQPDKWILPIASCVATFISFTMNQSNTAAAGNQAQTNFMNSMMKYIFPVTILVLARSYPAGLAIYWFVGQIVQIFFNIRFKSLRKKLMEEDAPKGKKKSKARA
jgi:YidC/Oxa1 family membrane protein insertase